MSNPWTAILDVLRPTCSEEDFRRWFGATSYASDSGDQMTVWVPSEGIRRHIERTTRIGSAKRDDAIGRGDTRACASSSAVDDEDEEA